MTVLGLDLNATRVRAVSGTAGDFAYLLPLQPPHEDLPMMVNSEGKSPTIGHPVLRMCRERPHAVYKHFLPYLGEVPDDPNGSQVRHHQTDCEYALALVFDHLFNHSEQHQGMYLSLPPYLGPHQVFLLREITQSAQVPIVCTITNPLAVSLSAFAENHWSKNALVVDVDDHALWLAWVRADNENMNLIDVVCYPKLGLAVRKKKLLSILADLCIKDCRRDPLHCPTLEQALYLQLDSVMEECALHRTAQVPLQKGTWHHQASLDPELLKTLFASFTQPVLSELAGALQKHIPSDENRTILISAQASVLPGLMASLEEYQEYLLFRNKPRLKAAEVDEEDFGENLLEDSEFDDSPRLVVLPTDAAARGAHLLAEMWEKGRLEDEHLTTIVPLPAIQTAETGPSRLLFMGRSLFLDDRPFTIGRRHDCSLVLEKNRYPHISPWHCEIVYDPSSYVLRDYSREGTWINDNLVTKMTALEPGDRIRLGPRGGPTLRFLGNPENRRYRKEAVSL